MWCSALWCKHCRIHRSTITPPILLRWDSDDFRLLQTDLLYILTAPPRYVLVPSCFKDSHCTNLIVKDDATTQVVLGLMDELMDPRSVLPARWSAPWRPLGWQGWRHKAGGPRRNDCGLDDGQRRQSRVRQKKIDLVDRGEDHYAHSNRLRADCQPDNRNIQIFNTSLLSEKN